MTQEDKELLLKDLCARIPYGVKVESVFINPDTKQRKSCGIEVFNATSLMMIRDGLGEFKPYLFPLSSMTVEHMCKVQNLLPNNCDMSFKNQKITFYDEGNIQLEQLEKVFNFFNLYHFDYRGLIPMGLAIDATGKNVY